MLTARRARFVQEMAACGNATEAARRAGYSEKTANKKGYQLMKIPEVREAVDKALEEQRKDSIADLQEVQEFLTAVLRGKIPGSKTRDRVAAANILQRRFPIEDTSSNDTVIIIDDWNGGTIEM
ncbi:putative phage terminase [Selenomonas ruminantium subsp. lactilytica TAM6421]|uniref:Putative phage terminase n=1 Tax=Selenomonas ruminantium subsp. lactilytica (strain NBRC 103574 / TAM6421) TaxID=927704 RepID=I0GU06_SELRL|nr:terminase small subunit [Selenomonas ruminantium]BAL84243.1 putative phage terminase [Selenomonas ruminantium subsp. lactilytica TAM6421]